ncbi:UDP-glucose 4-epimerase GalE [Candidatus Methylobacter oryzae]|uniref:UDP-glucose 4-epimerase n=1 Tax=Candidatus Methylobacter oryzae TaxID=2497749 RepID=A0ABY3C752_9GAMM|nr:UDP-glucose 4-epimerase GalE [Candidatus Methylobacter oryzae]TRW91464.1 UDP-glucose 4-epimerase GalE [Candidatus Methylobacter oryzae]
MKILVTGGAGFIGSHTCVELLNSGYQVVIVDNLLNSKASVVDRIAAITGKSPTLVKADVRDKETLRSIFSAHKIDAVIHFAGLKSVGESVRRPLEYYDNNIVSTLALCQVMAEFNVFQLVFSSSATVYGDPVSVPISEDFPLKVTNPYGRSKLFNEEILRDLFASDARWHITLLRYFNPVGAHESGMIGEDPNGIPNNLMPYLSQVAAGKLSVLPVYGDDWPTPDGTGVRDYIHVSDLASGHKKALERLDREPGIYVFNLGTGQGYSVLEMIAAFERVTGRQVPYRIAERRSGDIASCYADTALAQAELGCVATRGLDKMCADLWQWQQFSAAGVE